MDQQIAENKLIGPGQKLQEAGEKMIKAGVKMNQVGSVLTWLFTVPILGLIFFGVPGLIIGGIIGLSGAVGSIAKIQAGK